MTTIVLRAAKGSPLTNTEVDNNFSSLNTAKLELGQAQASATANSLLYFNGSKLPTTSSALTFDGAILAASGTGGITHTAGGNTARMIAAVGGAYWGSTTAADLIFQYNSNEQMRLTSTGLGIGTSSISDKLTVQGSGNFRVASGNVGIALSGSGWAYSNYLNAADNSLRWYSSTGGDRIVLDSSGNVGIGTTIPQSTLDVYRGTANSKVAYFGSLSSYTADHGPMIVLRNGTNGGEELAGLKGAFTQSAQGNYGYLSFLTRTSDAAGITEKMRLSTAGFLGIGTTNPPYGLTVSDAGGVGLEVGPGSQYSSGKLLLQAYNRSGSAYAQMDFAASLFSWIVSGAERARIDSSGRVSIGTSAAAAKLNVAGGGVSISGFDAGIGANLELGYDGTQAVVQGYNRTGGAYLPVWIESSYTRFGTGGVERARLDSSGNLGLGTAPSSGGSIYYKSFELGKAGCGLFAATNSLTVSELTYLTSNAVLTYSAGPLWTRGSNGPAATYGLEDGIHKWFIGPDGTAGTAISFTQAMTLDASGNLSVGTTSSVNGILLSGNNKLLRVSSSGTPGDLSFGQWDGSNNRIESVSRDLLLVQYGASNSIVFATQATERARINSAGNLLLGSSSVAGGLAPGALQVGSGFSGIAAPLSDATTIVTSGALEFNFDGVSGTQRHGRILGNGTTGGGAYGGGLDFQYYAYNGSTYAWATGARLDSSGKFGLGTTSPYATLDVGTRGSQVLTSVFTTGVDDLNFRIGAINGVAGSTGALQGQLGLFYLGSGEAATIGFVRGGGANDGSLTFRTNGNERARVDASGRLLVGCTSLLSGMSGTFAVGANRQVAIDTDGGAIRIRGDAGGWATGYYFVGSSGTNRGGFGANGGADGLSYYWVGTAYNGTGVLLNYGSNSWSTLSDEREKNIHGVIENALDKINQFDGVYYNYKKDAPGTKRRAGFSAQRVQAVFPEAVEEVQREVNNPTEETKRLTLAATEIVPLLVQAIKEQQAIITALNARVAALEAA